MPKLKCPDCSSTDIGKHAVRKNKTGEKIVYRCKRCKRVFVADALLSRMRVEREVLILALNLYNEGYSYGGIKKILLERTNTVVTRSTIKRWIDKFSNM